MTLLEYIKGKAEEKYTYPSSIDGKNLDGQFDYESAEAYTSGCKDTLEFMMKFDYWLHLNYKPVEEDNYQGLYMERESPFNTLKTKAELLTIYSYKAMVAHYSNKKL